MGFVRCEICHTRLPTFKRLICHYVNGHSKFELARQVLKLTIKSSIPKALAKKRKNKTENRSENKNKTIKKTEMVFANDNVQILYRGNEIIIRDDKSSVDMEFSFDENSNEATEKCSVNKKTSKSKKVPKKTFNEINNNTLNKTSELKKLLKLKNTNNVSKLGINTSSSSASSEDSTKKFSFKKRIRRRRDVRDKTRHYKINITRMNNLESLNETTGKFYLCHCRNDNKIKIEDKTHIKLASDTESASDTGRTSNFNDPKVFCSKCGNGYRDESLLLEHMKIHQTHCRVCNEIFPTEHQFKEHIQTHLFKVFVCHVCNFEFPVKPMLHKHFESHAEDSVLESVIDMEEDYNVTPGTIPNMDYQSSINNILCYLGENSDPYYYGNNVPKVFCDICHMEVFYSDYEGHMQNVHCIYGFSS